MAVHGVARSQTRPSDQHFNVHFSHTPSPPLTMRWKEGEGDETPPSQGPLPSPAKPVPGQQANVHLRGSLP